jgi:Ca2+-binding EF-hand superfamily protein
LYTEFLACTLDAKGPIDQKKFLEVFEQIDRSNKGFIAKEDLRRILPRSITDKYLQSLLKGANVNSNVGLSFEMFLASLTIDNHT